MDEWIESFDARKKQLLITYIQKLLLDYSMYGNEGICRCEVQDAFFT